MISVLEKTCKKLDPVNELFEYSYDFNNLLNFAEGYINSKNIYEKEINEIKTKIDKLKKLNKIKSTPEDYIEFSSTNKPGFITFQNFNVITSHEDPFLFGAIELDTKDHMAMAGEDLFKKINHLKQTNPDLENVLNKEMELCNKLIGAARDVASSYLNSLDIPLKIKKLYPSASFEKLKLSTRLANKFEKFTENYIEWFGEKKEEKKDNMFKRGLINSTLVPFFLTILSVGIPVVCYGLIKYPISKKIDSYMSKKNEEWPVHDGLGEKGVIQRFWNYFKYHPEKNVPVDFEKDNFNPSPDINVNYFPRMEFKKNVHKLYERMLEIIYYYNTNKVPLNDSVISDTRDYFLGRIYGMINLPKAK